MWSFFQIYSVWGFDIVLNGEQLRRLNMSLESELVEDHLAGRVILNVIWKDQVSF